MCYSCLILFLMLKKLQQTHPKVLLVKMVFHVINTLVNNDYERV